MPDKNDLIMDKHNVWDYDLAVTQDERRLPEDPIYTFIFYNNSL